MQGPKEKPYYTRVALVGIGMYVFFAAIILVAVLVFEPSEVAFPLILAAVALIMGAFVYFLRPWGQIVGVLGGLFGLLFSSDGFDINLTSPQSFFDFAFTLCVLAGAVFILFGSAAGLVQHFRHATSTSGPAGVTRSVQGIVGLVVVLSIISAILTVTGTGGLSAAEKEGAQTITAKKTKFDTDSLTASSSSTTKIVLDNDDPFLHTFTIDDLDIDVKMNPGAEKLVELKSPKAGTYEFYCRIAGHKDDIKGTLTVQ
jgi:uncharacterized cupredoxin-like copper-binding protein